MPQAGRQAGVGLCILFQETSSCWGYAFGWAVLQGSQCTAHHRGTPLTVHACATVKGLNSGPALVLSSQESC